MTPIDLRFTRSLSVRRMRKKTFQVNVEIADNARTIDTLEGPVQCAPGDAVITGQRGERWPVPGSALLRKYRPLSGTSAGTTGRYQTIATDILATRLNEDYVVTLDEGRGDLQGKAGDWLVQYEDGGQAIIAPDIFALTYEAIPAAAPLIVGITGEINPALQQQLIQLQKNAGTTPCLFLVSDKQEMLRLYRVTDETLKEDRLHRYRFSHPLFPETASAPERHLAAFLLKHSSFLILASDTEKPLKQAIQHYASGLPYWAKHGAETGEKAAVEDLFSTSQPAPVLSPEEFDDLLQAMNHHGEHASKRHLRYSIWQQWRRMLPDWTSVWNGLTLKTGTEHHRHARLSALADQIAELKLFNEEAAVLQQNDSDNSDLTLQMHQLADALAAQQQDAWQMLVFSTTKRIATNGGFLNSLLSFEPIRFLQECWIRMRSLVGLGLLATLAFAAFTELSGGCEENDLFAASGCATEGWKHWSGFFFLAIYLFALLLAFLRYGSAKQAEYERKHQDYRLFAEGLRVQYFWNHAGIGLSVTEALPATDAEDNLWVRNALRALHFSAQPPVAKADNEQLAWFRTHFIDEQIAYHEQTLLKRREQVAAYLSARARIGLTAFLLFIAAIVVNTLLEHAGRHALEGMAHHFLILAMVASLGWWAANKKILENFGLESEVRRGKAVLEALQKSASFLDETAAQNLPLSAAEKKAFLLGAGKIFVNDQASWHTLHRERPVEAATGG